MDATFTVEAAFHSRSFSVLGELWHETRKLPAATPALDVLLAAELHT